MILSLTGKKHMVFSGRKSAENMKKILEKSGCTVECLDCDEDWFVVYAEPDNTDGIAEQVNEENYKGEY